MRQTKYMRIALSIILTLCVFVQFVCAQEVLTLPYEANGLTEEQKAMNPDRLAYPTELKETIKNEVSFECTPQVVELGPFSVSATKQVIFSPGNLQFNAMQGTHQCADGTTQQGTWRFAEHQWDYVGDAESGTVYENGTKCSNTKINATYNGWIDLFGWGTSGWNSGANAYKPYATNTDYSDYYPGGYSNTSLTGAYANADWGVYNAIKNGSVTDPPGTWRTLTEDEWVYLFHTRAEASDKYGAAKVNSVVGFVILPDNWTLPSGCGFTAGMVGSSFWDDYNNDWSLVASTNIYDVSQWSKMEEAGAVFLPAAGYRYGTDVISDGSDGDYWSATPYNVNRAYDLSFHSGNLFPHGVGYRYGGFSVRLVR